MTSDDENVENRFTSNPHADFIGGVSTSDPLLLYLLPIQNSDRVLLSKDGQRVTDHYLARVATYIANKHAEFLQVRSSYNACEDEEACKKLRRKLHTLELDRDLAIHYYYRDLWSRYPDWDDPPLFTLRRDEASDEYYLVITAETRNWLKDNTSRFREERDEFKEWKYLRELAIYPLRSGT